MSIQAEVSALAIVFPFSLLMWEKAYPSGLISGCASRNRSQLGMWRLMTALTAEYDRSRLNGYQSRTTEGAVVFFRYCFPEWLILGGLGERKRVFYALGLGMGGDWFSSWI